MFTDSVPEYRQDGDLTALTDAYLGFSRRRSSRHYCTGLEPFGSAAERQPIADGLEASMRRAITAEPKPCAQIPLHLEK
jgi:hypothetical protein